MTILKMCLKQSFSHSKWVLQEILFLTVFSNCVSVSSNFDTAFLHDYTKICGVFLGYWTENLMRILKMCLKQSFFHFKWILQAILPLTFLSNCVSDSSNLDTAFLRDCTKFYSGFSRHWIRNLMSISKKFLKQSFSHSKWILQVILSLTVFSNGASVSSKFYTAFLPDCTKFCSVF